MYDFYDIVSENVDLLELVNLEESYFSNADLDRQNDLDRKDPKNSRYENTVARVISKISVTSAEPEFKCIRRILRRYQDEKEIQNFNTKKLRSITIYTYRIKDKEYDYNRILNKFEDRVNGRLSNYNCYIHITSDNDTQGYLTLYRR